MRRSRGAKVAEKRNAADYSRVRLPPRLATPPRVLPLLPIAFVGIVVGAQLFDALAAALFLAQLPLDGALRRELDDLGGADAVALELVVDIVVLIAASLVLRWLVRRWVVAQPPEPPPAA